MSAFLIFRCKLTIFRLFMITNYRRNIYHYLNRTVVAISFRQRSLDLIIQITQFELRSEDFQYSPMLIENKSSINYSAIRRWPHLLVSLCQRNLWSTIQIGGIF